MSKKQKTGAVEVIDVARLKVKDPASVLAKVKLLTDKLRSHVEVEKWVQHRPCLLTLMMPCALPCDP